MIKRLPSLKNNRPNSARRYIPPPNPTTTAIYQKVLVREAGRRDYYRQNRTSEQFVDDVENYIQESLQTAKDDNAVFKIYQNAFDYLIQRYQTHSKEMNLVKEGYDKVISELMDKNNAGNRYRIMVQQSFTSLNNEFQKKQAQFDKKKKGYSDLISSVKSTISDLRDELIELKEKLIRETAELHVSQELASQNQEKLDNLSKKIGKIKKAKKEMTDWIHDNTIRKAQLEEEAKNTQIHLSDVLDSISNSNKEIERTHASISELDEIIEYNEKQIKKKNDYLASQDEEKDAISKDILLINEKSEEIQNDMLRICRELANILENAGINNRTISMIGQDPVKLVALAVSKKRGYTNGIDPDILASLE